MRNGMSGEGIEAFIACYPIKAIFKDVASAAFQPF